MSKNQIILENLADLIKGVTIQEEDRVLAHTNVNRLVAGIQLLLESDNEHLLEQFSEVWVQLVLIYGEELDEKAKDIDDWENEATEAQERAEEWEERADQIQDDLDESQRESDRKDDTIADLETTIDELENVIYDLEKENEELKNQSY